MGFFDSLGSIGSSFSNLFGAASAGLSAYNAYQNYSNYQDMNDIALADAEVRSKYANELINRQKSLSWPYEDLQAQYALSDLKAMRPVQEAQIAAANQLLPSQFQYAAQRGQEQLNQYKVINPLIDTAERSLIQRLAEGEDVLKDRYMSQASADNAAAFNTQRASEERRMGLYGVNPNSGAFQDYGLRMGQAQALGEAGARTAAARQAEDMWKSNQAQAINYRAGVALPTVQQTSYSPTASTADVTKQQYYGSALTSGLANTYSQNFSNSMYDLSAWSNNLFGSQADSNKNSSTGVK